MTLGDAASLALGAQDSSGFVASYGGDVATFVDAGVSGDNSSNAAAAKRLHAVLGAFGTLFGAALGGPLGASIGAWLGSIAPAAHGSTPADVAAAQAASAIATAADSAAAKATAGAPPAAVQLWVHAANYAISWPRGWPGAWVLRNGRPIVGPPRVQAILGLATERVDAGDAKGAQGYLEGAAKRWAATAAAATYALQRQGALPTVFLKAIPLTAEVSPTAVPVLRPISRRSSGKAVAATLGGLAAAASVAAAVAFL